MTRTFRLMQILQHHLPKLQFEFLIATGCESLPTYIGFLMQPFFAIFFTGPLACGQTALDRLLEED
ncbi:hypothetical protein [Qipengyuania vesicularis]|uniref:hypothetical protein n=1 Tax=Qipengyuania vesicularis TaxID=2867232 RepID=UPI001C87C8B4|nr:hypothetical protein [Qipengyuania vesicularis]MBX7527852.1 hypothetical protein [Qipengyuania vesicularis]